MGITITRPVHVKVILTEEFKARRSGEIRTALAKLEVVGKQLAARVEAVEAEPKSVLVERLRAEHKRNESARFSLRHELEKISAAEPGSECAWGVTEGTFEVNVGDSFTRLGGCEIVVKDDKIIEIRDGLCPEPSEISS